MKIALPVAQNQFCMHFGHCETFLVVTIDENNQICETTHLDPPPHAPGVIPKFLAEHKIDRILAGGMGHRALQMFEQMNISVVTGIAMSNPDDVIAAYLDGSLQTGANVCDH